jgi:hypothetical protein
MVMWTCSPPGHRQANQLWDFRDMGGDLDNIENEASHKCLTILNDKNRNNQPIVQYDCNAGGNETWWPDRKSMKTFDGHDYYRLVNAYGKCLTVRNVSHKIGAQLLLFTCNRGDNQYWTWFA